MLEDVDALHATNRFQFGTDNRLAVGDDRQRFEHRRRQLQFGFAMMQLAEPQ
jgi:hypothetical protein